MVRKIVDKLKKKSNSGSPTHHGDSLTRRVGESPPLRLAEFSFKHSKADSATPRLSPSQRVIDSPTRRVGESFLDYEYLR
jgi:hypothetical protein